MKGVPMICIAKMKWVPIICIAKMKWVPIICMLRWSESLLSVLLRWIESLLSVSLRWIESLLSVLLRWSESLLSVLLRWSESLLSLLLRWSESLLSLLLRWSESLSSVLLRWSESLLSVLLRWSESLLSVLLRWSESLPVKLLQRCPWGNQPTDFLYVSWLPARQGGKHPKTGHRISPPRWGRRSEGMLGKQHLYSLCQIETCKQNNKRLNQSPHPGVSLTKKLHVNHYSLSNYMGRIFFISTPLQGIQVCILGLTVDHCHGTIV